MATRGAFSIIMGNWNMRYGRWWAIQWAVDGWFSLGVHLDFRRRVTGREGVRYGPYVDFHLGCFIVSLGVNPIYSGEVDMLVSVSRGGEHGYSN